MLRASCVKLEIKEFRCYEVKIEESEKVQQAPGVEPRTPGLTSLAGGCPVAVAQW